MIDECHTERRRYLETIHGVPFTEGNRVRPLRNGDEIFPAMLGAIESAEASINFLTYVYWSGEIARRFAGALAERARSGVAVRVLLDAYGANKIPLTLVQEMEDAGADVRWFRPLKHARLWNFDNRTHRKALICDDRIAFTGGVGVAREWEGNARNPDEWRETHFELQGPSVHGVNGAFWNNWLETDQAPPSSTFRSAPPGATAPSTGSAVQVVKSSAARHFSDAAVAMKALIELAERRLRICTPYLVLDEVFLELLCSKARSGVDMEILIPGQFIDKRFERWTAEKNFRDLIKAGVRIYRYQRTMIHTKILLVDDDLACIGSPNFNQRSLRKDDECLAHVQDSELVRQLDEHFKEDLRNAEPIDDYKWLGNPKKEAIKRFLLRPFREQL